VARGFVIQGFDRATDELRVELHLRPVPLERLRSLFDVGDDLEMAHAYPLDEGRARALGDLVSEPIDTAKYDFFLQRYA
jgi:hypothetical protein